MKLLLARHGETEYNRQWRFQGRSDLGLNRAGRRQAESLRQRLLVEPLDLVYASRLKRAAETAAIVADGCGLRVVPCENLAEISFGKFEGMTYNEIIERYPQWQPGDFDFTAYGGESLGQLGQRVRAFEKELRGDNPADADILVIAHSGPLRVLLCVLLGLDIKNWRRFHLEPASLTIVEDFEGEPVLTRLNDVSYLKTK